MTTAANPTCPITGATIITEDSDYGIILTINDQTCRRDLITPSMSTYYQGKADWQDQDRTERESTGEYGRNLDGVWGATERDDKTYANNNDGLDHAEANDGSSRNAVWLYSQNQERLQEIVDEIASQVPKYCDLLKARVHKTGDVKGYSVCIHYSDSPTGAMGAYNEQGVKRQVKILPVLREILNRSA